MERAYGMYKLTYRILISYDIRSLWNMDQCLSIAQWINNLVEMWIYDVLMCRTCIDLLVKGINQLYREQSPENENEFLFLISFIQMETTHAQQQQQPSQNRSRRQLAKMVLVLLDYNTQKERSLTSCNTVFSSLSLLCSGRDVWTLKRSLLSSSLLSAFSRCTSISFGSTTILIHGRTTTVLRTHWRYE